MSLCVVINDNKNIYVAVDTVVSKEIDGMKKRIGYTSKKIMTYKDKLIFMGGDLECALHVQEYIKFHGLDGIGNYIRDNGFRLFMAVIDSEGVTNYQKVNDFVAESNKFKKCICVRAYGVHEDKLLNSINTHFAKDNNLENALIKAYKSVSDAEVGGDLIFYDLYGNKKIVNIDNKDLNLQIDTDAYIGRRLTLQGSSSSVSFNDDVYMNAQGKQLNIVAPYGVRMDATTLEVGEIETYNLNAEMGITVDGEDVATERYVDNEIKDVQNNLENYVKNVVVNSATKKIKVYFGDGTSEIYDY